VPPSEFIARLNAFAVASGGVQNFYQTAARRRCGSGHRPASAFQLACYNPGRADRLDQPAVGDLLRRAERRDQGCPLVQEPGLHPGRIADRHGILLALLALAFERAGGTSFYTSPVPATGRSSPRLASPASTCGRISWRLPHSQPDRRAADRHRLHPQLVPDR